MTARRFAPPVAGATLMRAELLKAGDLIVFAAVRTFDIDVEEVETDSIGHVRVRSGFASTSFHPGELLWVVREVKRRAARKS